MAPDPASRVRLDATLSSAGAVASGGAALGQEHTDARTTSRTVSSAGGAPALSRSVVAATVSATIEVTLVRGARATDPDTFTATWQIEADEGVIGGVVSGEAVVDGSAWRLPGRTDLLAGTWNTGAGEGGVVADIELDEIDLGDPLLETYAWQVDAVVQ